MSTSVAILARILVIMGKGRAWGDEDVETVRQAMADGEGCAAIAKAGGWSYDSVKTLIKRLRAGGQGRNYQGNTSASRLSLDEEAQLLELHKEEVDLSITQLARQGSAKLSPRGRTSP